MFRRKVAHVDGGHVHVHVPIIRSLSAQGPKDLTSVVAVAVEWSEE